MQFPTATTIAVIAALLAGSAQATTFHNTDQAYTINVAHTDGSTSYVGPQSSVEVADGWAYIRACQARNAGGYFYCPPGLLTWPSWYGDVFFYMGDLTDSSGNLIAQSGDCSWGNMFFDPNNCPAGYQDLPSA